MDNKSKKDELKEQLEQDRKQTEERIELLKVKAGTASEADAAVLIGEAATPLVPRTFKQKWENFWYQYKAHVIFGVIIVAFAVFVVTTAFSTVKPDVTVGLISSDRNFYALTEDIAFALEPYCTDVNGDGEVNVSVLRFIGTNASGAQMTDQNQADVVRLYEEFRSDSMVMIITNAEKLAEMDLPAGTFADGRDLFPGDKNATEQGYLLDDTDFAEKIGWPEMPDGYFAAFRVPQEGYGDLKVFEENYYEALAVWRGFISGTAVEGE
ncbi:MAG: hypothetical protein LBL87_05220 [Ruminococcus sp.]|jgi:hypothetical protein|nr:hypothetical protein [Ruminococcus sp.]